MSPPTQNLTAVLFVLGLIYSGLLCLCVGRTYKLVLRRGPRSEHQRIFTAFYAFLWATLSLTITLYFLLSAQTLHQPTTASKSVTLGVLSFYFMPTILMVLSYVLLYQALELMMTSSRIATSALYRPRIQNAKIAIYARITTISLIGLFVAVQVLLMLLCFFGAITMEAFYLEIMIFTGVIVLGVNAYQVVVYCKLVGSPYKDLKTYKYVRHVGIVCGVWSVAFGLKFIAVGEGKSLFQIDISQDTPEVWTACILGLTDFFTIVIPLYCVIDAKFIKIMTCKHLTPKKTSQNLVDTDDIVAIDSIVIDQESFANSRERNSDDVLLNGEGKFNTKISNTMSSEMFTQQSDKPKSSSSNPFTPARKSVLGSGVFNWVHQTQELQINEVDSVRAAIEKKLLVSPDDFTLQDSFVKPWYPAGEKARRTKMGQLFNCTFQNEKDSMVCRVMNFERITAYQMESYFTFITHIHMLKLQRYTVFPRGVYINEKNTIHLIYPQRQSLYELVHNPMRINNQDMQISTFAKLHILQSIATILNTFATLKHKPMFHGHLNSQNVFVSIPENPNQLESHLRVQIDGFETTDLKKYANMFYSYKNVSVWSSPEVLKQPKKILEPNQTMDVYSYGFIMWELFHEHLPFDGDIAACTRYVLQEDGRPKINEAQEIEEDDEEQPEITQQNVPACSGPIANLIRACWVSDPAVRPTYNHIIDQLTKEMSFYKSKNEQSSDEEDSDYDVMDLTNNSLN